MPQALPSPAVSPPAGTDLLWRHQLQKHNDHLLTRLKELEVKLNVYNERTTRAERTACELDKMRQDLDNVINDANNMEWKHGVHTQLVDVFLKLQELQTNGTRLGERVREGPSTTDQMISLQERLAAAESAVAAVQAQRAGELKDTKMRLAAIEPYLVEETNVNQRLRYKIRSLEELCKDHAAEILCLKRRLAYTEGASSKTNHHVGTRPAQRSAPIVEVHRTPEIGLEERSSSTTHQSPLLQRAARLASTHRQYPDGDLSLCNSRTLQTSHGATSIVQMIKLLDELEGNETDCTTDLDDPTQPRKIMSECSRIYPSKRQKISHPQLATGLKCAHPSGIMEHEFTTASEQSTGNRRMDVSQPAVARKPNGRFSRVRPDNQAAPRTSNPRKEPPRPKVPKLLQPPLNASKPVLAPSSTRHSQRKAPSPYLIELGPDGLPRAATATQVPPKPRAPDPQRVQPPKRPEPSAIRRNPLPPTYTKWEEYVRDGFH